MKNIYTLKLQDKLVRLGHKIIFVGQYSIVFSQGVAQGISEDIIHLILDKNGKIKNEFIDVISEVKSELEIVPSLPKLDIVHEVKESPLSIKLISEETGVVEKVVEVLPKSDSEIVVPEGIISLSDEKIDFTEVEIEKVKETIEKITEVKEEIEVRPAIVSETEETKDLTLSKKELQQLYKDLGNWNKVAKKLDVSTTTLTKYRKSIG
jgi:hypothetical protein